jgi:hypothetical protein
MPSYRIDLVTVGTLRQSLDVSFLKSWSSALFEIRDAGGIAHAPNASGQGAVYTDDQLERLITPKPDSELTIAVINGPLEQNFYSRRLRGNLVVLSLYQIAEILSAADIRVENFILRAAYVHSIYRLKFGCIPLTEVTTLSHDEVRRCLFDMNINKADIVESLDPPHLCELCRASLAHVQTFPNFLPTLDKELGRIRRALYFRLSRWVQRHPIWSIAITAASAVIINVLSSAIYDKLRSLWH